MSKLNASKGVNFSSDQVSKPTPAARNRKRIITVFWVFRLPKATRFSPEKFLRRLGAKVAKVLRYVSFRRRSSPSSLKPVSASNFNRSHSVSDSMDSHRAEAVEDCIEFFNSSSSSSSLPRSDSVSGRRCP